MNELITLARPYARASFEHAYATKALVQWSNMLAILAAASEENVVNNLLSSPKVTAKEKAAQLIGLCGEIIDDSMERFLILLAENGRLSLLPQIKQSFENLRAQQEKLLDIELHTAFPLDEDMKQTLIDKISTDLDSRVSATVNVDKTLIG
ncbi:MAG: F0F1 ATP synthase subunit delta, partial [Gammaproteobacteria bacterium]|nr:F0F1 ATP synthase subunit delta [Gammaproteobacteria bacterium]